ncbi:MAG: (Fe-S)-binding protein [Firmicutes bacterium]|nr:(Fe-S)-binding protein [Bacillota bacterium]
MAAPLYMPCIKCGLCLSVCPTYQLTQEELESPRGRVQLIAAVDRGVVPLDAPEVDQTLFDCLDCRACEVACPSGVPIGELIETGRAQVTAQQAEHGQLSAGSRLVRFVLRHLFPYPQRLERTARALRWMQRLGLIRFADKVGLLRLFPAGWAEMARALPQIPSKSGRSQLVLPDDSKTSLPTSEAIKGTAALFLGCILDVIFPQANLSSAHVLAHNGWNVCVPADQRCCGALAIHAGDREAARALARRNIDAFLASGADTIVTDAGGCGAALLEYPQLLADDPAYAQKAQDFASRVQDIAEVLVQNGFEKPAAALPMRVTYQESCHLHNVMHVISAPRQLLDSIDGLEIREMPDAARCCGSAGIYNLTHPQLAEPLLARKMADVPSDVDAIVTGNPGCWLQLLHGVQAYGPSCAVTHTVCLLDAAYNREVRS